MARKTFVHESQSSGQIVLIDNTDRNDCYTVYRHIRIYSARSNTVQEMVEHNELQGAPKRVKQSGISIAPSIALGNARAKLARTRVANL